LSLAQVLSVIELIYFYGDRIQTWGSELCTCEAKQIQIIPYCSRSKFMHHGQTDLHLAMFLH